MPCRVGTCCAAFLEQLVEDERILEDALNRFDEDGTHVKAGDLGSQQLYTFEEDEVAYCILYRHKPNM